MYAWLILPLGHLRVSQESDGRQVQAELARLLRPQLWMLRLAHERHFHLLLHQSDGRDDLQDGLIAS